ncbi:MAG: cyclic nucleotide-binding domain-containing protein [Rhizomicrobium sp.]
MRHDAISGPSHQQTPSASTNRCRFVEDMSRFPKSETAPVAPLIKIARRSAIYSRGDEARHCYKVLEGAVRLMRILMDGHRQVLEILLPNETFCLEITDKYTATAEAISDVVLLRCPRTCISRLHEESPEIQRTLVTMPSKGLTAAQNHVMMLGHQGAKARLASFL